MKTAIQGQHGAVPTASRTLIRTLSSIPDFQYFVRLSPNPDPSRVLVLVHGISRQPSFMLRCLADRADELDYTLMAPVFNHRSYSDYQRLGRDGRGQRADLAFRAMLMDAGVCLGLEGPVHLMGFSGGAQFAHRFVYAHPGVVRSLTLAAAGWYTAPDRRVQFPYGTAPNSRLPDLNFDIDSLLRTPSLTLVGERDTVRDAAVRRSPRLDKRQGRNRLTRARWFHRRLEKLAAAEGYGRLHRFHELPRTAHDFGEAVMRGGLADQLFAFCEENAA